MLLQGVAKNKPTKGLRKVAGSLEAALLVHRSTLETQSSLPQRGCVTLGKALTLSEPRLSCVQKEKGIRSFIHSRSQLVSQPGGASSLCMPSWGRL